MHTEGKRKMMHKNKPPKKKDWQNNRGQSIPCLEPAGWQFYSTPCPELAFTNNQGLLLRVYSPETSTSHSGSVAILLYVLRWFSGKGHPCWCSGLAAWLARDCSPSCHCGGMFSGRSEPGLFWRQSYSGKNKPSTVHFKSCCQNLLKLINPKLV